MTIVDGILGTFRLGKTSPASPSISKPMNFMHNEHWDMKDNNLTIERFKKPKISNNRTPPPPSSPVPVGTPLSSTLPPRFPQPSASRSYENLRTDDRLECRPKLRSRTPLPNGWTSSQEKEAFSDSESIYEDTSDYDVIAKKRIVNSVYVNLGNKNLPKARRTAVKRAPTGRTRSRSLVDERINAEKDSIYVAPSLIRCQPEEIAGPTLEEILNKQETSVTAQHTYVASELRPTDQTTSTETELAQQFGLSYIVTTSIHVNAKRQKIISVQHRCISLDTRPTFSLKPSIAANNRAHFGTSPVSITSIYGFESTPPSPQVTSVVDTPSSSTFFTDPIEISMTPPTSNSSSPLSTFTSRVLHYSDVNQQGGPSGNNSRNLHLDSVASSTFSMSSVIEAAMEAEQSEEAKIVQIEADDTDDIVIHF